MSLILKLGFLVLFVYFWYIATEDSNPFNINFGSNHKHIDAIFQRCTGSCNTKFCNVISSCRPINRTSKLKRLDIYLNDGIKLEAPIFININTFKKFRTEYRPLMLKYKEELCQILKTKNNPVFEFFYIRNISGNLLDPCPFSGHRYESPKLTTTWVGTLVPTGEWKVDFSLTKVIDGVEQQILTISYFVIIKAKDAIGADDF